MTLNEAIRRGDDAIALLAAIVAAERQVDKGFTEIGGTAFLTACSRRDAEIKKAATFLESLPCPK